MRSGLVVLAGFVAALTASLCAAGTPLLALPSANASAATLAATTKAGVEARRILPNIDLFHAVADKAVAIGDEADGGTYPESLRLELAPGVAFDGQVYRVERSDNGAISLSMKLAGQPLGFAVLTELDGRVHGMVMMPGGRWQVKSLADGSQIVEKLDDAAFPPDGQPIAVHGAPPHAGAGDGPLPSAGNGNEWLIDVMIVWDAAAQAAAGGGAAGMQTMAANAVAIANTTYANSGIAQRLRLVYSGPVAYTERTNCPGGGDQFDCALDDITNDVITSPATLSSLRTTHGADLVTLLIADDDFCGIAWLPDTISSANSGLGFSVVSQACAVGNLSYPHELGHNMGANHDAANATAAGPKPYNYGSYNAVNAWRTVMAYPDPCNSDAGRSCARLPFFSNPDYKVDYDGPGGEPAITLGTASTQNNAMVLNLTAKSVAAYRDTSSLHPVSASFTDVPTSDTQFGAVEFLKQSQITSGCTANTYCVGDPITRRQMAVFLERARKSSVYAPPAATGIFVDVPQASQFADYVEALKADGITQGCTANQFCPDDPVSRAQMAIFILRASCGPGYTPAAATGTIFADVSTATSGAAFIEKLYRSNVTQGCGLTPLSYCPNSSLTRGQMAVFMERSFPLLTPSEVCTQ